MKCNSAHKRQKEAGSSVFHFPSIRMALGESQEDIAQLGELSPAKEPEWKTATIMDSWTKAEGREERAKSGKGLTQGGEKCLKNDILHAKLLHNKNILFQHLINSYFHYEIFKIQWKEGEC